MSILPRREFLTKTTLVNNFADSKTSKDEITNSRIRKFKVLHAREPSKIPGLGVLLLTYILLLKNIFALVFFILKALKEFCSTLNSWIGEFVVSFFDVTNRLKYEFSVVNIECRKTIYSLKLYQWFVEIVVFWPFFLQILLQSI